MRVRPSNNTSEPEARGGCGQLLTQGRFCIQFIIKRIITFPSPLKREVFIYGVCLKQDRPLGHWLHSTVNSRANSSLEVETEPKEATCLTSSPAVAGPPKSCCGLSGYFP